MSIQQQLLFEPCAAGHLRYGFCVGNYRFDCGIGIWVKIGIQVHRICCFYYKIRKNIFWVYEVFYIWDIRLESLLQESKAESRIYRVVEADFIKDRRFRHKNCYVKA